MRKELRKKLDAEMEALEAVGTEGKKGVKYAKEHFKQEEKKATEEELKLIEQLNLNRKSKYAYNIFLAEALIKGLSGIDFPPDWVYRVSPTDRGVVMEIEIPGPRYFRSAFQSTGDGFRDFNAIKTFMLRADNLIDNVPAAKSKSGIFVS